MTSPTNLARESESITRLSNVLLRHVVPLFKKALGKRPSLVGNGLLVSSGRSSFLVSAAHVFDEHSQLHFYVEPGVISKLNGRLLRTKLPMTGHRLDDRVDIGVLRLDGEALPPYKKMDKFALPISALRPHALPRENKQYLVVGFPATKSKANPAAQELKSEPVSFRNIAASTSKYSELRISTESHIAINLDLKHVLMPDGSVAAFVKPAGLSGSPVWLLYDEHGPNDPHQTSVVGITIEYHEFAQALIASDIETAIKLIEAAA